MRNFRISKLKISALEYISALRNNINFRFVTFFKIKRVTNASISSNDHKDVSKMNIFHAALSYYHLQRDATNLNNKYFKNLGRY